MVRRTKKGFTLIELIVVVVVLAVLAAVAIPMVSSWVGKAGESERAENRRTIELLIKAYMAENSMTEFPPIPEAYEVFGEWFDQYASKIAEPFEMGSGEDAIPGAKLNNPGTGHYIVNKYGEAFVEEAESDDYKGFLQYDPDFTGF